MRARPLLFDLDGTLVDSAAGIAEALSAVRCERGGGPIEARSVRPLVSLGAETLVAIGLGELATDAARDLAAFRDVLRSLPADPRSIFPGVLDTLAELAAAGHPMAIVTNKPEGLSRTLLTGLNLGHYFDAIVGGDSCGVPKPDPAPLLSALRQIGGGVETAAMIGDSEIDAAAAAACGLPFYLYDGGYGVEACAACDVHARFAHFADLPSLLSAASPSGQR